MAKKTTASGSSGKLMLLDIEKMEKMSLEKANKAISAIENALAVWDLSKEKPDDLEARINKLKYFHEALTRWEKKMLLSKDEDIDMRVARLKEFTDICYMYT